MQRKTAHLKSWSVFIQTHRDTQTQRHTYTYLYSQTHMFSYHGSLSKNAVNCGAG